jgi:hypothetical protein
MATASDACGSSISLTFTDATTTGACTGAYSVTRTWTATDGCGNSSSNSQTINVQDVTAPVIASLPAPSTINCPAIPVFATATATDACGSTLSLIFADATTNGACAGAYSVTRTWTAMDECGNSSTNSQTINVQDITAPVIASLPAPSTINCPAIPVFATATATDACGSTFSLTFADATTNGACAGAYSVTRTWTATDGCGNSSTNSQTINVQDVTAPVIASLPAPSTINCPATPVFAVATASDACGSSFSLTFTDASTNGACAGSYSVTRTWTATDGCGNSSTSSQTINVQDIFAPVIASLPAPSTINCPATPVFAVATASDECGSAFALTSVDATTNGACAGSYSVTRTWTATDGCGNSSSASQMINVQDITAPVIASLPAPTTINCPSMPVFTIATASDACGSSYSLTFTNVTTNGACEGSYSVTRTWTATDGCGNSSTASQTINVQDISAPVIASLPAPSTINCPATPVFATATASDACGSSFDLTFSDVTTTGACTGAYSVTRTWIAADLCGNSSSASQTINVQDITAPVIASLPAPSTINCPATPVFEVATATDACGSSINFTFVDATTNGACAGSYSVTRTWTATDGCGNSSTESQTINVQDITAPVIDALPAPTLINCPAVPVFALPTAIDECGSSFDWTSVTVTTPGACAGAYSATRTWTVTDGCGNSSTASQTINVQDISPPVIASLPPTTTINCPAMPVFAVATATDECGSTFTLISSDVTTQGICPANYAVTRTWTATDQCGNISTASQTINVQDVTAPVIDPLPAPTTINCPSNPIFTIATAFDACGSSYSLTWINVTTNGACHGYYSVTRTWTATDVCGNSSTSSQTINVQDVTAPVISALPVPSSINCPSVPVFAVATASDACNSPINLTFTEATTAGSCAGTYSVVRTWTAVDDCLNSSSASQVINVVDDTPPAITGSIPPSNIQGCFASVAPPPVTTLAALEALGISISDGCSSDAELTVTNSTSSSGTCPIVVTRIYFVTDICGNSSSATAIYNITDTTPPSGAPPVGTFNSNLCAAFAQTTFPFNAETVAANYADNCGGLITITLTNTLFVGDDCGWVLVYTFNVSDPCGNMLVAHSITHTGSDQTAPVGIPPGTSTDNNACKSTATTTYPFDAVVASSGYTDNCGGMVTAQLTNTQVVGSDCSWAIIYTFSVLDPCNNVLANQQMVISGGDHTPPTFTRPADIVIYSDVNCNYDASVALTGDVTNESDNCSVSLNATYTDNVVAGPCACSYIITRTWHLVDACGNAAANQVQTISVYSNIVTNTNDSGPGSLRDVVSCALDSAVISFAPALLNQVIVLTSGEILINKNITLTGLGINSLMVSGNMASRIFQLLPGYTFKVTDMALKNASSLTEGGAILIKGNLILENIVLQNNYENGVHKAMTIQSGGSFEAMGSIQVMN